MLIVIAGGLILAICYGIMRWALSLFIPERAFRRFEHACNTEMKVYFLVMIIGFIGLMIYITNFSKP